MTVIPVSGAKVTTGFGIEAPCCCCSAVIVKVCVLLSPSVMPDRGMVTRPAFCPIVDGVGIGSIVGALLGLTVTANVTMVVSWPPLAVPPLSITVTVMFAVPIMPAAGV